MDNERNANIAARRADLREMLAFDIDHFEGIDKDDALHELLDLLDEQPAVVEVDRLARLMDTYSDDGQWDGADICDALGQLIAESGGWERCDEHGLYAASNGPDCHFTHDGT